MQADTQQNTTHFDLLAREYGKFCHLQFTLHHFDQNFPYSNNDV
jgi:hypothetical protein